MEILAIGTVRTAWGVKGWVKITSFSGEWEHFSSLKTVSLKGRNGRIAREYVVEGFRMHHGGGLMKLVGIDSPEAGKALSGSEILVPREAAAPLDDNEWYLNDLVGLRLFSGEHDFGEVTAIIESADDLLEIERPDGSRFMIPFRQEFVGEPDLKSGRIELLAPWLADET